MVRVRRAHAGVVGRRGSSVGASGAGDPAAQQRWSRVLCGGSGASSANNNDSATSRLSRIGTTVGGGNAGGSRPTRTEAPPRRQTPVHRGFPWAARPVAAVIRGPEAARRAATSGEISTTATDGSRFPRLAMLSYRFGGSFLNTDRPHLRRRAAARANLAPLSPLGLRGIEVWRGIPLPTIGFMSVSSAAHDTPVTLQRLLIQDSSAH